MASLIQNFLELTCFLIHSWDNFLKINSLEKFGNALPLFFLAHQIKKVQILEGA